MNYWRSNGAGSRVHRDRRPWYGLEHVPWKPGGDGGEFTALEFRPGMMREEILL